MAPGDNISHTTIMCLHGSIIYLSGVEPISLDGFGVTELELTKISKSLRELRK